MMVQSTLSLVIAILVVARAINVLPGVAATAVADLIHIG
jgi:hypothetical protein